MFLAQNNKKINNFKNQIKICYLRGGYISDYFFELSDFDNVLERLSTLNLYRI